MCRTRLFTRALPLVALLSACSGGQQSSLPPDPSTQSATAPVDVNAQAGNPADPGATTTQDVTSTQNPSTQVSSTQIQSENAGAAFPQSLAAVPAHIATWAYDEYWGPGAYGTTAQVREYLTYAQDGAGNDKAANDCTGSNACKSVVYFGPNLFYDTAACGTVTPDVRGILRQSSENWFVHETGYTNSIHRIAGHYTEHCNGRTFTIPVYAMNTLAPAVRAFYASYLHTWAPRYDEFMMDNTSGEVLTQFYGPGGGFCGGRLCSTTQEMRTDAAVVSEHGLLANALTHPNGTAMRGVFNGLNFTNGRPNDLDVLRSSSHFHGVVCEGCVMSGGLPRPALFPEMLNAMAEIDAIPGASLVMLNDGALAGNIPALNRARTLTTAMAWLGYSEGHTIVWPNLEQNTLRLTIFPENSIYPSSPVESMRSGATDIQVASHVYRREFRACYYRRAAIGPCAAIVNGSYGSVTIRSSWLAQRYGHAVELIGSDIPSGGRISLTGVPFYANRTYIGSGNAILLVR